MALGESHTHVEATCSLLHRAQILPKSSLRAELGGSCSFAQTGLWTRAQECSETDARRKEWCLHFLDFLGLSTDTYDHDPVPGGTVISRLSHWSPPRTPDVDS